MTRMLMALSLISLVLACARKDAGKGHARLSGQNEVTDRQSESSTDSTFYIGYVDYFPETREFYTTLFHREESQYPDAELLEGRLDSVILLEDDWGRERLPMADARALLMMSGLDTLTVFNRRHEQICHCPLKRVEYLWNGIESYFVAVFASDRADFEQTEELYGISGHFPMEKRSLFSAEEIADKGYDEYLMKKLQFSTDRQWDMRHYRIDQTSVYSVISSYSPATSEFISYLTVHENDRVDILNEEMNNFQYLNILPVPINMNGRPLLLISAGYPSTDVLWDYLAGFDGTGYEAIDYNRIHLNSVRSGRLPRVLTQTASIR